ncbi:MAG TPA: hypothetical protein VG276_00875 [Actinomycetes bacterium]|jgi:hypothetical protein|nr:hypothetical protein [Actinomycetes bacterium]
MLNDYVAALIAWWQNSDLARSALPDAPVEPDLERRNSEKHRRMEAPLRRTDRAEAGAPPGSSNPARSDRSSWRVTCPCGEWGLSRDDRDAWLALCQHPFPQLDRELDVWEYAHGWLYR